MLCEYDQKKGVKERKVEVTSREENFVFKKGREGKEGGIRSLLCAII